MHGGILFIPVESASPKPLCTLYNKSNTQAPMVQAIDSAKDHGWGIALVNYTTVPSETPPHRVLR